jgi:hypothetical protein
MRLPVGLRSGSAVLRTLEIGAMSQSADIDRPQYLSMSHTRLSRSDILFSISCSAFFMAK